MGLFFLSVLASYNWYSNSRLFLELQYAEKIKKLKRTLKSDTNFVTNRLYMKIADSKYRTRSLTTLLSYESYETFDSQDTISRILDDNDLTPAEKTMRILGITDQDIIDARAGKKEREDHRRLTEVDDELFKARRFVLNKFYMLTKDYEDQESFFRPNNEELVEDSLVVLNYSIMLIFIFFLQLGKLNLCNKYFNCFQFRSKKFHCHQRPQRKPWSKLYRK